MKDITIRKGDEVIVCCSSKVIVFLRKYEPDHSVCIDLENISNKLFNAKVIEITHYKKGMLYTMKSAMISQWEFLLGANQNCTIQKAFLA